jgi:1-phosphofructokinase
VVPDREGLPPAARLPDRSMTVPAIFTVTLNPAIDQTVYLTELVPGTVHRARHAEQYAGGKGVNVASCLSDWRLSSEPPIIATGFLGQVNAPTFQSFFDGKGIVDRFIRLPGQTRRNIKLLDETAGDTTDINLPGLTPQAVHLDELHAVLEAETQPGAIAVLSGSLPPGLPETTYRDLVGQLNRRGARVLLDTSGLPFREALAAPAEALPWAIKPNQHELEEWAGKPFADLGEMVQVALKLCRRGIGLVIVSRGAEGALFVSERHVLLGHPPLLTVTSTVGAGDALVAGVVAALREKADPERLARLSLAFAAAKLVQPGPDLPDRAAVLAQVDRMKVERL